MSDPYCSNKKVGDVCNAYDVNDGKCVLKLFYEINGKNVGDDFRFIGSSTYKTCESSTSLY